MNIPWDAPFSRMQSVALLLQDGKIAIELAIHVGVNPKIEVPQNGWFVYNGKPY